MLTASAPHTAALIVVCGFKAGAHLQGSFQGKQQQQQKNPRKSLPPAGHQKRWCQLQMQKVQTKLRERLFMKQMNRRLECLRAELHKELHCIYLSGEATAPPASPAQASVPGVVLHISLRRLEWSPGTLSPGRGCFPVDVPRLCRPARLPCQT